MTPLERHAIEAAERCLAEARSALDRMPALSDLTTLHDKALTKIDEAGRWLSDLKSQGK